MPQMKPMNWMILFMMLNLIIMMMNIKNYFFNLNFMKKNNLIIKNKNKKMNWKW